jgi:hypothetical protein
LAGFRSDILPKFNASTVSTFTSKVSNRIPDENRLNGISFQERWSAVPTAERNGKKNEPEPRAGGPIEKLPFSCEPAFSRLVQTGNFSGAASQALIRQKEQSDKELCYE